jgi:hypothetical protein
MLKVRAREDHCPSPHPEERSVSKDEGVSREHWNLLRDAAHSAPQDEVRGRSQLLRMLAARGDDPGWAGLSGPLGLIQGRGSQYVMVT